MAGTRSRGRAYALQVLYAHDVGGEQAGALAIDGLDFDDNEAVRRFGASLVGLVDKNREAIDERITRSSKNWRLDRMSRVDRNILRLATAELIGDEPPPDRVVINEAVELAKRFGTADSAAFVNGILDRIATSR